MLPIDSIKRMELKPGDIIVLKSEKALSHAQTRDLEAMMKEQFPGYKGILLAPGLDINAISPEELEGIPKGHLLSQKAEQA
jgi:hypothetical protein